MINTMKPDQQVIKELLRQSIIDLCQKQIQFKDRACIEGHLKICVDDADAILLNIDAKISKFSCASNQDEKREFTENMVVNLIDEDTVIGQDETTCTGALRTESGTYQKFPMSLKLEVETTDMNQGELENNQTKIPNDTKVQIIHHYTPQGRQMNGPRGGINEDLCEGTEEYDIGHFRQVLDGSVVSVSKNDQTDFVMEASDQGSVSPDVHIEEIDADNYPNSGSNSDACQKDLMDGEESEDSMDTKISGQVELQTHCTTSDHTSKDDAIPHIKVEIPDVSSNISQFHDVEVDMNDKNSHRQDSFQNSTCTLGNLDMNGCDQESSQNARTASVKETRSKTGRMKTSAKALATSAASSKRQENAKGGRKRKSQVDEQLQSDAMFNKGISDNSYLCGKCDMAFPNHPSLLEHYKIHSDKQPFICDSCGKAFSTKDILRRHSIIHSGKSYICNTCGKSFAHPAYLRDHLLTHNSNKQHVCETCGKAFRTRATLQKHGIIHTDLKPYACSTCERRFAWKHAMTLHERSCTEKKTHSCKYCGENFTHHKNLQAHYKKIHGNKQPFNCVTCGKTFTHKWSLNKHSILHLGNTYVCDTCGKTFTHPAYLRDHALIHNRGKDSKQYVCETCGKLFKNRSSLHNHRVTHSDVKPHVCNVCNKTFARKHDLACHQRTHTGEKKYICDVCGKGFIQGSNYKQHYLIHTGGKPHKCDTCGKHFRSLNTLKRHLISHSGEKPCVCKVCGKAFSHPEYLTYHQLTHTGEKPFSCDTCGKSFSHPANLRQHNFIHSDTRPHVCSICDKSFGLQCRLKQHYRTHMKDISTIDLEQLIAGNLEPENSVHMT